MFRETSEPAAVASVAPAVRRSAATLVADLLVSLRPKQWTKNAVVFAALVFDLKLFRLEPFMAVVGAFACFCLASSTVYLINDLRDVESDRLHPRKRLRPIASGRLRAGVARAAVVVLLGASMPVSFALDTGFGIVLLGYLMLMIAYTAALKHMVIVDVFAIAAGFVLRAAAGGVVLDVPISPWLYVCTVLLALFIGFGKRRHELLLLEEAAGSHRRNLEEYSEQLLDQFILVTAAATVMAYALYTIEATNLPENNAMMLTIPFVVYAIFRYLFLIHRRDGGGSPELLLLSDRPLLTCIFLWGITSVAILYST